MPSALSRCWSASACCSVKRRMGSSADGRVVVLNFLGAGRRDQSGQGLAAKPGKREIDNIGVAKKIKKKRLDRLRRVRAAELKENYS